MQVEQQRSESEIKAKHDFMMMFSTFSGEEKEGLREYMQEVVDKKFRNAIKKILTTPTS